MWQGQSLLDGEDKSSQEHVPMCLRTARAQSGPAQGAEGHSHWCNQRGQTHRTLVGSDMGTACACTNSFPELPGKFTDLQYPKKKISQEIGGKDCNSPCLAINIESTQHQVQSKSRKCWRAEVKVKAAILVKWTRNSEKRSHPIQSLRLAGS